MHRLARRGLRLRRNLTEPTNDWFAHAKTGDVWYCGEETAQYQVFPGDNPQEPELVGIEGLFKAGRDGAKAGIILPASLVVGTTHREEFKVGDAEDVATVVSTSYSFGHDAELDQGVPADLANFLCANDCVVTKNFSGLEPDAIEHKFYTAGIGLFLEVDTGPGGSVNRLIGCNVDPRCDHIPQP